MVEHLREYVGILVRLKRSPFVSNVKEKIMSIPKLPSGSGHVLHDGDMIGYMFQPDDLIEDAEFLLANGFRLSCYWEDHGSFHEPIVSFYLVVGEYVDYKFKSHPFKRLHTLSQPRVLFPSMTLDEVKSKVHEARKRISDLFQMSRKHSY